MEIRVPRKFGPEILALRNILKEMVGESYKKLLRDDVKCPFCKKSFEVEIKGKQDFSNVDNYVMKILFLMQNKDKF